MLLLFLNSLVCVCHAISYDLETQRKRKLFKTTVNLLVRSTKQVPQIKKSNTLCECSTYKSYLFFEHILKHSHMYMI